MIPLVYMAEALDDAICCVGGVLLQDGGGSQIDRRRLAGLFFYVDNKPSSSVSLFTADSGRICMEAHAV